MISYLLLGACVLVFFASLWLDADRVRARFPHLRRYALVLQIGAVLGAYATMRPGRGVDGARAVIDGQKSGHAVMLDLYSNF